MANFPVRWTMVFALAIALIVTPVPLVLVAFLIFEVLDFYESTSAATIFVVLLILCTALAVACVMVVHSLWVRRRKPPGIKVSRKDAPALWQELDGIAKMLEAPPISELIMDDGSRADVSPMWQFGPVASSRMRLYLGVQLLYLLEPADLTHVLLRDLVKCGRVPTREFAKYQFHVEMNLWYFDRVLERIQARGSMNWVQKLLFRARDSAMVPSVSMSLWQNWQRRVLVAHLMGEQQVLEISRSLAIYRAILEDRSAFPIQLLRRFDSEPPKDFLERILDHLQTEPPRALVMVALQQLLRTAPDSEVQTFTSYARQAELAGLPASTSDEDIGRFADEFIESIRTRPRAVETLLGRDAAGLISRINDKTLRPIRRDWRKHQQVYQMEHGIARHLEERMQKGEQLTQPEADMLLSIHGARANRIATRNTLRELVERFPGHGRYPFELGMLLLNENDAEGLHFLQLAHEREFRSRPAILLAMAEYELRLGNQAKHEELQRAGKEMEPLCEAATLERAELRPSSSLTRHAIPDAALEKIRAGLKKLRWVHRIHAARVQTRYFEEQPWHALSIELRPMQRFFFTREQRAQFTGEAQQLLMTWMPGDYVWYFAHDLRWAANKIRRVGDSLLHENK